MADSDRLRVVRTTDQTSYRRVLDLAHLAAEELPLSGTDLRAFALRFAQLAHQEGYLLTRLNANSRLRREES